MDQFLLDDLLRAYGIAVSGAVPVCGGWMNRKWRVSSDRGDLLVKEFSRERFGERQLMQIADALRRQMRARECGIPCPEILTPRGSDEPVRFAGDSAGTVYMVMTWCGGGMLSPETVTPVQMRALGDVCGRMHAAFATLPNEGVKNYPIDADAFLQNLRESHAARRALPGNASYRAAVLAEEPLLDRLTPSFFANLPKGIAHEDFSPDNLLFTGDTVSAVLDFDRCSYSFLCHDVGRALLSLALDLPKSSLNPAKAAAFLTAYSAHLPSPDLPTALLLTWCIETPWWIQPSFFGECSPKVARFRDEVVWLTEWLRRTGGRGNGGRGGGNF